MSGHEVQRFPQWVPLNRQPSAGQLCGKYAEALAALSDPLALRLGQQTTCLLTHWIGEEVRIHDECGRDLRPEVRQLGDAIEHAASDPSYEHASRHEDSDGTDGAGNGSDWWHVRDLSFRVSPGAG